MITKQTEKLFPPPQYQPAHCYQSSPSIFWVQRHTSNTHDRMVGSRHTQVRCEQLRGWNIQRSLPHCSTKQRWVFGLFQTCSDSMMRFLFCPFLFGGDSLQFFCSLLISFLESGVSHSVPGTQKKERKKNQINWGKKDEDIYIKKILFNFWFGSCDFSVLFWGLFVFLLLPCLLMHLWLGCGC